jgi:hypothetical protein
LVFARHFFIALVLSLAAIVSACQSPGNGYLMNGIGAELSARDIESATTLQRKYFDHLCAQAGLGDGGCALGMNDRASWTLVVQQGMNDIDRRCDAYLEWLDNQKRNRGPLLSQVSAVQNTASAIIGFVAPGSTKALNVVLAAFGLLTKSIENYNSRLILDIESSTINSVVLRARNDFRQAFSGKAVGNKPEAEYVLREYLRRCLPFAIETQINDLSTLGSRGIRASQDNSIFEAPVGVQSGFNASTSTPSTPTNVVPVRPGRDAPVGAIADEKRVSKPELKEFQGVLCVPRDGDYGAITRTNIVLFQIVTGNRAQLKSLPGVLDKRDIGILRKGNQCQAPNKNYFESVNLTPDLISSIAKKLKEDFAEVDEGSGLSRLRPFIEKKRRILGLDNGPNGLFSDQITPDLVELLFVTE